MSCRIVNLTSVNQIGFNKSTDCNRDIFILHDSVDSQATILMLINSSFIILNLNEIERINTHVKMLVKCWLLPSYVLRLI